MLAAVDVGSNTVRLLLAEVSDGQFVPVRYEREITRLGGGAHLEKGLSPTAMERTIAALRRFGELIGRFRCSGLRLVGTEALRQAPNSWAFVERIRTDLGLELEIIDGVEEARLSARGVAEALRPKPDEYLVFDIGGGSTEVVLCRKGRIEFSRSYPLGVVALAETCHTLIDLKTKIDHYLEQVSQDLAASSLSSGSFSALLVGTAGTVTTLAAIDLGMTRYDWRLINNHRIEYARVLALIEHLLPMSICEREQLPGLEKGRGDLMIPGLLIVAAIMRRLNQGWLAISDFGLLEGALLSLVESDQPPAQFASSPA
ncbi:MAG: Ppx/GppA phosphatase family protein [Desulfuromonadaceae bacterium]